MTIGRKWLLLLGGLALVACGSFQMLADDDNSKDDNSSKTLVVDDDKVQCPNAKYTEIQAAVLDAPPGATIHVCPGTYKMQVTITKPLTIVADTGSILQPTMAVPNSMNVDFTEQVTALLAVNNTRGVSIDDLTVDGSLAAPTACAPEYVGVMFQNSSGTLTHMAVRNIKLGPGLEGCQSGEGIFVQNPNGDLKVNISDSSIHDYQKTGIIIDLPGSDSSVNHNYVTGIGSTPNIAQNGIQISRGAMATVSNNFVNNHLYSLCTDPVTCPAAATNILVYSPAGAPVTSGTTIRNNTAGTAQIGIAVQGNNAQVQNNDVYDNRVFDGIDLLGNNNHAASNNIFHSDTSGVFVMGNNNHVDGNTINEAPIGVLIFSGSGNQVNGNKYFNVVMPTNGAAPGGEAPVLNSSGHRVTGR